MVQASEVRAPLFGLALVIGTAFAAPDCVRAAEPEPLLSAPEDCGDSEAFEAAIRELAGKDFDSRHVRLDIAREATRWLGVLTLPQGQRELEGESCSAVLEAAAVVVALSLEEQQQGGASSVGVSRDGAAGAEPEARATTGEAALSAAEMTAGDGELTPAPSRKKALRLMLRAGLMGEVGLLPAPSLGPRLRVTFESGLFSLDVGAVMLLSRRARLRTGESADIHWFAAQVAACRKVRGELRACFGGEAGRIVGTGSGVDVARTASGNWLAVTADASYGGTLAAPFSWEVGFGVGGAVILPEFGFDDLGTLHRPSSVSGRLFVSLGWQ